MFQSGAGATGESGLVLRADPASGNIVTFGVNQPSRTWSLRERTHGRWTDLQPPTSSNLIEPVPWSTLLAVIMHGDEYALFINYHFVGVYHSGTLTKGRVGIFASDGTVTCGCVDVSVYRNVAG